MVVARESGWNGLIGEQREYLDTFWQNADVELDGDKEIQQAVRFSLFHVLQAGARNEQRAIPAKGLTGTGYDATPSGTAKRLSCPFSITRCPMPCRTL